MSHTTSPQRQKPKGEQRRIARRKHAEVASLIERWLPYWESDCAPKDEEQLTSQSPKRQLRIIGQAKSFAWTMVLPNAHWLPGGEIDDAIVMIETEPPSSRRRIVRGSGNKVRYSSESRRYSITPLLGAPICGCAQAICRCANRKVRVVAA